MVNWRRQMVNGYFIATKKSKVNIRCLRKFRITVEDKKHFESLIKDYRKDGFMIVTYGKRFAEMEKDDEFITIENSTVTKKKEGKTIDI